MVGRTSLRAALLLAVLLGAAPAARAEVDDDGDWMLDYTALTMAPDGAWGAATAPYINQAIAGAIARCRAKSAAKPGCGAHLATVRAGWSLGLHCGDHVIVVAERMLDEAERSARRREDDLRANYAPGMPACVRVVTVDPNGTIVTPKIDSLSAAKQ